MADKKRLVLTMNDKGQVIFHQDGSDRNDDWIKVLEKRAGNPDEKAFQELERRRRKQAGRLTKE